LICRLVFAKPQEGASKPLQKQTGFKDNPLYEAFKAAGVEPLQEMLITAEHLINDVKLNTGEAVFFAANHIEADEDTHAAYTALKDGATFGENLKALFESAFTYANEPEDALNTGGTIAKAAATDALQNTKPFGAPESVKSQTHVKQVVSYMPEPAASTVNEAALKPKAAQSDAKALSVPKETEPPPPLLTPVTDETEAQSLNAAAKDSGTHDSVSKASEELKAHIRGFFAQTEQITAESLKDAAAFQGEKLKALEAYIKSSDTYNKRPVLEKLTPLLFQSKFLEGVTRFISLQIPFNYDSYKAAELYVYKRNRKGAKLDPENLSAVLGLKTEEMGRVEAHIKLKKRSVSINFKVERESALPMFLEKSAELANALGKNFSLAKFGAERLIEKTTLETAEANLNFIIKAEAGSFDYRV
ncbi:MAG TPA: flagellar hook-length control protein FliK, partial [Clostridia bacterium]|nr:flagellar hook-length control protein FliK [Clostridia bacterium]